MPVTLRYAAAEQLAYASTRSEHAHAFWGSRGAAGELGAVHMSGFLPWGQGVAAASTCTAAATRVCPTRRTPEENSRVSKTQVV